MSTNPAEQTIRSLGAMRGLYTVTAIARAAGIDRLTLRRDLDGVWRPRRGTVQRLSQALGVPPNVIARIFEGRDAA